jgi:spore germination protein YaaH
VCYNVDALKSGRCGRKKENYSLNLETITECCPFNQLGREILNNIFLMLQMCTQEVMLCGEGNGYKNVNMNKGKLRRNRSIKCKPEAMIMANNHLNGVANI